MKTLAALLTAAACLALAPVATANHQRGGPDFVQGKRFALRVAIDTCRNMQYRTIPGTRPPYNVVKVYDCPIRGASQPRTTGCFHWIFHRTVAYCNWRFDLLPTRLAKAYKIPPLTCTGKTVFQAHRGKTRKLNRDSVKCKRWGAARPTPPGFLVAFRIT